jgi:hypothetical protein
MMMMDGAEGNFVIFEPYQQDHKTNVSRSKRY